MVNGGKTPAFNVKLLQRVSLGRTPGENRIVEWKAPDQFFESTPRSSYDVLPNVAHHQDLTWRIPLDEAQFARYTKSELDVNLWSRIEYCSQDLFLHWTVVGLSKTFAEDEPLIRHINSSAHPGVTGHSNCVDPASGEQ